MSSFVLFGLSQRGALKKQKTTQTVKEVVKALKKGEKGVCVIAGDISPIDVISHLPVFCEESAVPYVYVPSKQDLGAAAMTKRPTSCVLIVPRDGFKADEELYAELMSRTATMDLSNLAEVADAVGQAYDKRKHPERW